MSSCDKDQIAGWVAFCFPTILGTLDFATDWKKILESIVFVQTSCKHGKTHCAYFVKALRASPPPAGLARYVHCPQGLGTMHSQCSQGRGPQAVSWGGCNWDPLLAPGSHLQLRSLSLPEPLLPLCPRWPQHIPMRWLSCNRQSTESGSTAQVLCSANPS